MSQKYRIIGLLLSIVVIILMKGCARQIPQSKENGSDKFIEISLNGGGFYGGINPTTENKKTIKSDGKIIVSGKSFYDDRTENSYSVSRNEVEKLADFISAKGFFTMKDVYDCSAANQKCEDRKHHYPPAVPIRIHATIGDSDKTVTVTVHEENMVEYPAELDTIINKINGLIDNAKK